MSFLFQGNLEHSLSEKTYKYPKEFFVIACTFVCPIESTSYQILYQWRTSFGRNASLQFQCSIWSVPVVKVSYLIQLCLGMTNETSELLSYHPFFLFFFFFCCCFITISSLQLTGCIAKGTSFAHRVVVSLWVWLYWPVWVLRHSYASQSLHYLYH